MNYKELAELIAAMTPEQQSQPVQVINTHPVFAAINEMQPVVSVNTVDNFGIYGCRSITNNKRNGTDVVLLLDGNPFAEDGATGYLMNGRELVPQYGPEGPTRREDQVGEVLSGDDGALSRYQLDILTHRMREIKEDETDADQ